MTIFKKLKLDERDQTIIEMLSKNQKVSQEKIAKEIKKSTVCGLARSLKKDIDACVGALKPAKKKRIHVFLATSKIHMQHKLKKAENEVIRQAVDSVKYAKKFCKDIEFSPPKL